MSKFKAKKRAFFKSGLALCGEKKVYEKTYFDQSLSAASDHETFKWHPLGLVYDDIDNITLGTGKANRIGQKIYLRYITINLEIYSGDDTTDFPYVRLIFGKDRAANQLLEADLPEKRCGRPKVSRIAVLSDNCLGMDSDFPGASVS